MLCDSGASGTVIRRSDAASIPVGKKKVYVVSADGVVTQVPRSKDIPVTDPETNKTTHLSVIVSSDVPYNLLGRDVMLLLGIGVVPDKETGRMKVCRLEDTMVVQSHRQPKTYYSLDLTNTGPNSVTKDLLMMSQDVCWQHGVKHQTPENMHVTMNYRGTKGPDPAYEKRFFGQGSARLVLKEFIWTDEGQSAVTVTLPDHWWSSKKVHKPLHVSLSKNYVDTWYDVADIVRQVESKDWSPPDKNKVSHCDNFHKSTLNWVTMAKPHSHLN